MPMTTQEEISPQKMKVMPSATPAGQNVGSGRCSTGSLVQPGGVGVGASGAAAADGVESLGFMRKMR